MEDDLRHLIPWHRALATLPGARWCDEDGLTLVHTGSPFAGFNVVLRAEGADAVERAAHWTSHGAWTRFSPGATRDTLDERLVAAGFAERTLVVMAGALDDLTLEPHTHHTPDPDGQTVEVGVARSPAEVSACADLMAESFGIAASLRAEFRRVHVALGAGDATRCALFALRAWGAVVSTCMCLDDGDRVSVSGLSTLPSAWGRGFAAQVGAAALRHARSRGARRVVVSTEPGGRVVAGRLGLVEVGVLRHLHRQGLDASAVPSAT